MWIACLCVFVCLNKRPPLTQEADDACGTATTVTNTSKIRPLPLLIGNLQEISQQLDNNWSFSPTMYVCALSSHQTWLVSCTVHCVTLGNLRNFHLRGVGTLKREHRFLSGQEPDHMLLQSTLSAHLLVLTITAGNTIPTHKLWVNCTVLLKI